MRAFLPIESFCIAAGIPSMEKATEIIGALHNAGIKHVAFKPGSVDGIGQVVTIATANPDFPIILHKAETGGILTISSGLGKPIHKVATCSIKLWREFKNLVFKLPKDKHVAWLVQNADSVISKLNKDFMKPWFAQKKDGTPVKDLGDSHMRRWCFTWSGLCLWPTKCDGSIFLFIIFSEIGFVMLRNILQALMGNPSHPSFSPIPLLTILLHSWKRSSKPTQEHVTSCWLQRTKHISCQLPSAQARNWYLSSQFLMPILRCGSRRQVSSFLRFQFSLA
jgi:Fatty acid synthase subunit beta/Fas1-like, helical